MLAIVSGTVLASETYGMMQQEAIFSQKLNILSNTLESASSLLNTKCDTYNYYVYVCVCVCIVVVFADLAY